MADAYFELAPIAQLVEYSSWKLEVVGSIPGLVNLTIKY